MKRLPKAFLFFCLILTLGCAQPAKPPQDPPERTVKFGSGNLEGLYYFAGASICDLFDKRRKDHKLGCLHLATLGSPDNVGRIRNDLLDFAVMRSDWAHEMLRGLSVSEDSGPFPDLRTVFSLYPEPLTIIVHEDAGVRHIDDLAGKQLKVGFPRSTRSRATWSLLQEAVGWSGDSVSMETVKPSKASDALCDREIDAYVLEMGHPSGWLIKAITPCDLVFVEASGPAVDALVAKTPYLRHADIPGGVYLGSPEATKTIGLGATLVSSTKTPAEDVYWLVKSFFEDLDKAKRRSRAFSTLKKEEMVRDGFSPPLHEGALRYYREAGLL